MKKKYLTAKEKERRLKKGIVTAALILLGAALLALGVGLIASRVDENRLRIGLQTDYFKDPWDGGKPLSVLTKDEAIWPFYEAILCIEDEARKDDPQGVVFDGSAGSTLCLDASKVEDESLRKAVGELFSDYAARKGLSFRTGTLEALQEEGRAEKGAGGAYKDGCLLQILQSDWDSEGTFFTAHLFFYYSGSHGQGATVAVCRSGEKNKLREYMNLGDDAAISDDGRWAAAIVSTIIA